MSKKSKKPGKPRNWIAVHAHLRGGSGHHPDKRKQSSKRKCRGKVRL
jgi:hypothetical protein|tara:strand:+ start:1335 stop:1475 length:141 start_codon:yes stop_codon:yes gene_type:complete